MKQTKLFALSSAFALAASVACAVTLDSYTFESAVNAENADTTVITAGTKDNADAISKWALQNKAGGAGSVETPATLVAYEEGGVAKPTKTTAISGGTNNKFLNLSTDGDRLLRNIKADGTAQAIDAAGIFIDTLVQFSVTEDTPPDPAPGDKLAIWLQGDENAGTKTLMVKAATVSFDGETMNLTPTAFAIKDVTVVPDTWYRLTVKSIANVFSGEGYSVAAFKVLIDGVEVKSSTNACGIDDDTIAALKTNNLITDEQVAALKSGALFPSLVESDSTLTAVGFQGEGKIDDYVVSTDNPIVTPLDFVLTFPTDASTVSYTIDGGTAQVIENISAGRLTIPGIKPGQVIAMTVTKGHGSKVVSVTAAEESKTASITTVDYSWYFNQNVQGTESDPILVASGDDLTALANMVADGISTAGLYFKQTAEAIILKNFAGIGDRYSGTSVEKAFAGVYDGDNKTITVNSFAAGKYAGIFNTLKGTETNLATLKKLVVNFDNVSYENVEGENGCATVGTAENYVKIDNVTVNGSITSTHNSAGFIALVQGNVTFINCTNTCTITGGTNVGSFIGRYDTVGSNLILQGTNKAQADIAAVGDGAAPALSFATVEGGVATFATPVAGGSYKVMASGATVTLANIGDTITLDTTLATATVETSVADAHVESADGVYTVVADRATVNVSVSAAPGTTITGVTDGTTATEGNTISFTVAVDNAYKANTLVVKNGNETLTADQGTYTITVGKTDIAITTTVEAKVEVTVSVNAATGTTINGVTAGKALEGATLTFTVTVASGYDASTLVVKNGDTPLTADGEGKYSITVDTADIAIKTTVEVAKTPSYVPSGKEEVYNSWAAANKDALDKATPVVAAEAFALNCAPTAEALATAKAEFKVTITMVNGVPHVTCPEGYNITPVIMSSDTVNGTYTEGTSGKFFKAVIRIP